MEEALCFGWIDGKVKRIDEERYMQRYTPRRKGSVLSESNVKRVEKLIEEGKMTEMGMEKIRQTSSGISRTWERNHPQSGHP